MYPKEESKEAVEESKEDIYRADTPLPIFNNGRLDKQNPTIALKVLMYLKNNPEAFNTKFRNLSLKHFRNFVKYLATHCGATIYLKRAVDPNSEKQLRELYGNLKKWYVK